MFILRQIFVVLFKLLSFMLVFTFSLLKFVLSLILLIFGISIFSSKTQKYWHWQYPYNIFVLYIHIICLYNIYAWYAAYIYHTSYNIYCDIYYMVYTDSTLKSYILMVHIVKKLLRSSFFTWNWFRFFYITDLNHIFQ